MAESFAKNSEEGTKFSLQYTIGTKWLRFISFELATSEKVHAQACLILTHSTLQVAIELEPH